jgi:NitT/TauT family transport system substrate-binding protein
MPSSPAGRLSWVSIGVLLLTLSVACAATAEPLRIRYAVWVGDGPLFLAQQKGYFAAENVEVQLIRMEDPRESFLAMGAGRLDGIVSTIDTMIPQLKTGKEFQYVLALDDSAGGDGIVARKEIKSVRDLRGRRVAVQEGSVSQFFLNVLLRDAGLSEKDVQVVNMKPGEAGAAFVAGKVDAAVTWEPWLSNGRTAPHGHMLVDSTQTPGLITDVLVFRRDVIERRPREIQSVVDAWNKAVAYWERNPAESNAIMARAVGDWLEDPKLFADVLTGVRFYNRSANVKFFGTPQKPGPLYKVVQNALDITGGLGNLQVKVAPKDLVNHSFVK